MILKVKISPNASQTKVEGWQGDTLKIRIAAPPDKGKANETLIELLAETYSIPKSRVQIISGHASRNKRIELKGL